MALVHRPSRAARSRLAHVVVRREARVTAGRSWARPVAVLAAALAVFSVVGGLFGIVLGAGVGIGLMRWLASLPRSAETGRERARAAELPVVTDLMAACLASGADVSTVLDVVSEGAAISTKGDLRRVASALRMGAAPDEAWQLLGSTDMHALATVMQRSAQTGAPAAYLLSSFANELRAKARTTAVSDARRLGVRSAGPLGLCFLPAFILIGVVPLVLSLVRAWT